MTSNSALLIIDVQKGLFDGEAYEEDAAVLNSIQHLLAKARQQRVPVVYIQHDGGPGHPLEPNAPGWPIYPSIAPQDNEIVIRKRASDAFYETTLHETLQSHNIQHVIVTGAMTEYCVDTTCRRAASLNYDVTLVSDGHLTSDNGILTGPQIIAHHNLVLSELAHSTHPIHVQPAKEVELR